MAAAAASAPKKALITGITGQDGSYLAELLLSKGYEVHGLIRRSSSFNTGRIDKMYQDRHEQGARMFLHYADLSDSTCLCQLVSSVRPDEIYNLAAMSHVKVSFEMSEYTADVDALGCLRLLNAIRVAGLTDTCKFYQASTSELYGGVQGHAQNEETPFYPRSPYAVAKQFAYWICINYREAYGMFTCNGVLFNHESPRRGPTFLTRKVSRAVARIRKGMQECLYLGNLEARRDWGHAREYVEGMWRMLQQETPDDFVLATGETHTVRSFVEHAFTAGGMTITWAGEGVEETGTCSAVDTTVFAGVEELAGDEAAAVQAVLESLVGKVVIRIDEAYYRPTEVDLLLGDASKAAEKLGWTPSIAFAALCEEMVLEDCKKVAANDLNS